MVFWIQLAIFTIYGLRRTSNLLVIVSISSMLNKEWRIRRPIRGKEESAFSVLSTFILSCYFMWRRSAKFLLGIPVAYGVLGVGVLGTLGKLQEEHRESLPAPVTSVVRFYEANYRSYKLSYTVANIAARYYLKKRSYEREFGEEAENKERRKEYFHDTHQSGAERFLSTLETLGGVFIKLGQEVSMMQGILPDEYVKTFAVLQDEVPTISFEEVRGVIRRSFGQNVENLFETFDQEPIASASIAQVHRATLKDGSEVAVKVQYPRVSNFLAVDLALHSMILDIYRIIDPSMHLKKESVEIIHKNLRRELDFTAEVNNLKRAKEDLKGNNDIYIPFVIDEVSNEDVLTMEYIHGFKITDKKAVADHHWDTTEISRIILQALSDQIFKYGFVHADPHPGNVFIRENPQKEGSCQVVLLDHGLYAEIDNEFRLRFAKFWKSVVLQDTEKLEEICKEWGVLHPDLFASLIMLQRFDKVDIGPHNVEKMVGEMTQKDSSSVSEGEKVVEEDGDGSKLNMLFKQSHLDRIRWMEMMGSLPPQIHLIMRSLFITRALNVQLGNLVNRFDIMALSAYDVCNESATPSTTVSVPQNYGFKLKLYYLSWQAWFYSSLISFFI